ncbi:MAG TPA: hypothetical protein VM577_09265 [Anaerovoracaceae bacterium]|nr:hypothetical protein [Anaerovoracaceae bacterium]
MNSQERQAKVVEDLKKQFDGATLLTPKQVAIVIQTNEKVQANMRSMNNFPIPVKQTGKKILMDVYDIAEYVVTGKCSAKEQEKQQQEELIKKAGARVPDPSFPKPSKTPVQTPAKTSSAAQSKSKYGDLFLKGFRSTLDFYEEVYIELERLYLEDEVAHPVEEEVKKRTSPF